MRDFPIERVLRPLDRFIHNQALAGLMLFVCAAIAVFLANSPWSATYFAIWEYPVGLQLGDLVIHADLLHVINDGLMAIFFFMVALELKREFIGGELSDRRNAMLPIAASVGGMLVPSLLFLLINGAHGEATRGWGITLGTDTAFVLGILALLGKRVPPALKVLFITVSVADDIAAVSVIALFYTSDLSMANLGIGAAFLAILVIMNLSGYRNMTAYGVVGIAGVWLAFMLSGVHATVAGVLAAFAIPAQTKMSGTTYTRSIRKLADDYDRLEEDPSALITPDQMHVITKVKRFSTYAETPAQRLEKALHPLVSFLVLPLFALANAGIVLPDSFTEAMAKPVTLGVFLGLVLGKPIGLIGVSWIFVKLGWGKLATGVNWHHLVAISVLSGLGFTMAIFISELAFVSEALRAEAKLGVLFASVTAAIIGTWLLIRAGNKAMKRPETGPA